MWSRAHVRSEFQWKARETGKVLRKKEKQNIKMIYAEETVSKRYKIDVITFISSANWRYVFSFLENLNLVKEVSRKFVDRNWITRIAVKVNFLPTPFTRKLSKMFETRQGGVEFLDLSKWKRANARAVNLIIQLRAFRQLKELNLGDCENITAGNLQIPAGIKIIASGNNPGVRFLNIKGGMSTFQERMEVFYDSFKPSNGGFPFFTEVCEALKVEIEDYVEEDEEPFTLLKLYRICAGNFERMLLCEEASSGLIKIRGLLFFLMVKEKENKFVVKLTQFA